MTTVTISAANINQIIAQDGTMSALRQIVAGAMHESLRLVDCAAPYDVVPRQLWCGDGLGFSGPVRFQEANITFGSLAVTACPATGQYEVDCSGALTAPIPIPAAFFAGTVHGEALRAAAQQRVDGAAVAVERVRAATRPPTSIELMAAVGVEVEPPPEPPPKPQWMVDADAEAARLVEAEQSARAAAQGSTTVGQPPDEIRSKLLIVARRRAVEEAAGRAANAETERRAAKVRAERQAAHDEATRLLREQGFLKD
jgi:hypothetical protein